VLWLALHCLELPLEVHTGVPATAPAVVAAAGGGREVVVRANAAARSAGVEPGMALSAARVRAPALWALARDAASERARLEALAGACLAWSDSVALEPPTDVLVEIGASLELFGGVAAIQEQVAQRLAASAHTAYQGVAPTPAAARLLARTGGGVVTQARALERALAPLPWRALEPEARTAEQLASWGISTLGACFALPRAGLARRLGPAFVDQLDRLRGRRGEPLARFEPPARFHGTRRLPAETSELDLPLQALEGLMAELEAWLRGRDAGIQRFEIDLYPARGPRSSVCVGLAAPARQAGHLLEVARERLERAELPGSVEAVGLRSHRAVAYRPAGGDLWHDTDTEPPERLLERLRARLGGRAVRGVTLHADHRPERAWSWHAPGAVPAHEPERPAPRPVWLLAEPAMLPVDGHGRPQCDGGLELLDGPERIETGWWDGDDVERDYFVAANPAGTTLWVYRERRVPRLWYVQGVFA